ncbi:MAG: GNAT family N-acetyltransferase [Pseudomonadota bacterium]
MKITYAEKSDLPEITRLAMKTYSEHSEHLPFSFENSQSAKTLFMEPYFKAFKGRFIFGKKQAETILKAVADDQLVGYIFWLVHDDHICIRDLRVVGAYQGLGIAEKLIAQVKERAGKMPVVAYVLKGNEGSAQLFKNCNFETTVQTYTWRQG